MSKSLRPDPISYEDTGLDRREFIVYASVLTGSAPLLAGCAGDEPADDDSDEVDIGDDDTDDTDDSPDSEPRYGGTLQVASQEPFDGADTQLVGQSPDFTALRNMVEPLFISDYDGNIIPWLAEGVEIEDDGHTWIIPLNEDAHFHPPVDHTLTAEDVVRTYERVINPDLGSSRAEMFNAAGAEWYAEDEKTFAIDFTEDIFAGFRGSMASRGGEILPAELIDDILDTPTTEITHPIGTGPYVFDEWIEREGFHLNRYDNYWLEHEGNQLPYFDRIVVKPVTEASIRLTEMVNKDLHVDHEPAMDFIESYQEEPGIRLQIADTPMGRTQIAVNCSDQVLENRAENPPTLQSEVRHAINETTDRNDYIDLVYRGLGTPNEQYYPPQFDWCTDYAPWGPDQDIQAAEDYLDEVGYDGSEIVVITRSANERGVIASELVQDHLQAAGMEVEWQLTEYSTWADNLVSGRYDIRVGAGAVEGDPIIFDRGRYMERESPQHYFGGPDNRSEEVGELFDEAAREADLDRRIKLYNEGFEIIADDSSYIMACHSPLVGASINEVQNIREHPTLFNTNWRECWFDDPDEFTDD